jgi:MFS family permease
MSFLQVIAARLIEGSGKRKRQMMIAGVVGRSLWTMAALMPLLAPFFPTLIGQRQVLNAVIGCVILAGAFQAFNTPAFFSWMTDLVPSRVRPSFFARRMQTGTWVALVTAIIAGLIADNSPHLSTYCILLALAGIFGLLDILFFIGVREPRSSSNAAASTPDEETPRKSPALFDMVRVPVGDAPTRRFLLFASLMMISYGVQGPFLWLHALEYLKLSKTMTGVLLTGVPLVAMAISLRFWGEVIRRYGNRPVMRFCSMGIALASFGWLVARPGAWDLTPILLFFSGTMAGALELANQNLITGLSPHIPRASMAATFSVCVGLSFAAASWCGGALAQSLTWINDSHYFIFGIRLVNYHILFLISLGLRLFNATFIAPRLQEPEATGTVDTVKEVFPEVAQAFAARFTRPLGLRED